MKIYQVGGCVRDMLIGNKPHDFDYVVTGADIEMMKSHGFIQVGKDFPVFLHPLTKEEYALARKESEDNNGVYFGKDVSLEDDLKRRDFTCNSIAYDMDKKEIIDVNNGREDIKNKILRHINDEYFKQDALRVLRMCRFSATLDFKVAEETLALSQKMVEDGMLQSLATERVFKEIEKAMLSCNFCKFILCCKECGVLRTILPEVNKLWDIPEKVEYHPEKNAGEHTILALKQVENQKPLIKFAVLLHDIGKIKTPESIIPSHYGHENNALPVIKDISKRLKIPNDYKDFALLCAKNHMKFHVINEMRLGKLIDLVDELSAKHKNNLEDFILVCFADMMGRKKETGAEEKNSFNEKADFLRRIYNENHKIKATDMPNFATIDKTQGFKKIFRDYRIKILKKCLEQKDEK